MLLQGHIGKSEKFAQKLVYTYSQLIHERISRYPFFVIKIFIELTHGCSLFVDVNYVMDITYIANYYKFNY